MDDKTYLVVYIEQENTIIIQMSTLEIQMMQEMTTHNGEKM
jgi:hypothetical protein